MAIECVDLNGDFSDAELQRRIYTRLGCRLYGQYRVVVRHDVRSIPWFSKGVRRIEEPHE
jgi:hypothetical protein